MTRAPVYWPRPTSRRSRRTQAEIHDIKLAAYQVIEAEHPMTVRQVFYQLVSRKVIDKTEQEYKGTVVRLLAEMRRDGDLPFHWIADNTRWMRKPRTHDGLADLMNDTAALYRRSVWSNQKAYVEIWLEKDALAGVLYEVTREYDVPLMVTRGYPSITFLHGAAEEIADVGKPAHLYYFGDRDPSGLDIPRKVEAGIREFAPDAEIHFERVAVTDEQVNEYDLPTRPTKQTDSRARNFDGESVEVDAIAPGTLRDICRDCIERHIDSNALATLKIAEASERDYLRELAGRFNEAEEE